MRIDIKNLAGVVLYTAEIADDVPEWRRLRDAVEAAVRSGASLDGASLDRARLDGASLDGASLDGASLDRARLVGASLVGASLVGASLVGARLDGARLDGASLDGARLVGASLVGARPIVTIGPIGSRNDTLTVFRTDAGLRVRAGCFFGTDAEFLTAVEKAHGDTRHGADYRAALACATSVLAAEDAA